MHIVYVIDPFGGPETYLSTLLPYLKMGDHQISVIYTNHPTKHQTAFTQHLPVYHVSWGSAHYYLARLIRGFRGWAELLRIWELSHAVYDKLHHIHKISPIDVVEVTEGIFVQQISRKWPVVLRAHGSAWTFYDFCEDGWDRKVIDQLKRRAAQNLRYATTVSSISKHLADYLSISCDFPRDNIVPVSYPIDLEMFSPAGNHVKIEGDPILLTIGRMEHRKGTDILVGALPLIWDKFPNLKVVFLGKESQFTQNDLRNMVPTEFKSSLIFPGFVSHASLPEYYRAATLYIAPTQYETFGYTILEAMACGVPVISCPVGAVPELVEDDLNGCLVPFGDHVNLASCITGLLNNPKKRLSMSQEGRKLATHYDVSALGLKMEQMYQQTLKSFRL